MNTVVTNLGFVTSTGSVVIQLTDLDTDKSKVFVLDHMEGSPTNGKLTYEQKECSEDDKDMVRKALAVFGIVIKYIIKDIE